MATVSVVTFGGAVGAFAVADDAPLPTGQRVVESVAAPRTAAQLEALAKRDDLFVTEERIRRGDTVGTLLTRLGVSDGDAERFLRTSPSTRVLQQLRPGRLIQATTDDEGALQSLRYAFGSSDGKDASQGDRRSAKSRDGKSAAPGDRKSAAPGDVQYAAPGDRSLLVERAAAGELVALEFAVPSERRVELRSGEIRTSLFAATDDAGLPDGIAGQIAEIFSGDIDFYRDLRRGDRFRLVYETFYQGGEFVRAGRILAIEFVNGGKPHSAMWYGVGADAASSPVAGHYYGFDGRSLRRAFLRTPLEFTRISSGFGGRLHPIANVWRQHTGVDYAAPMGTPVRTTADGVVDFAGVKSGYGNVVVMQHQGVYSTLYGHLSHFAAGLKRGQRIQQGTLVGYVGMTGWATGPHLHYEFRIADHATDPLTAALPEAPPIGRGEQQAFRTTATTFDRQIALLRASEGFVEPVATARGGPLRTSPASPG